MVKSVLFPLVTCVLTLSYFASADDKLPKKVKLTESKVNAVIKAVNEFEEEGEKEEPSEKKLKQLHSAVQKAGTELSTEISDQVGKDLGVAPMFVASNEHLSTYFSKLEKDKILVTDATVQFDLDDKKQAKKEHAVSFKNLSFNVGTFQEFVDINKKLIKALNELNEEFKKTAEDLKAQDKLDKDKVKELVTEFQKKRAEIVKPGIKQIEKIEAEIKTQLAVYGVTKDSIVQRIPSNGEKFTIMAITPKKGKQVEVVEFSFGILVEKEKVMGLAVSVEKSEMTAEELPEGALPKQGEQEKKRD